MRTQLFISIIVLLSFSYSCNTNEDTRMTDEELMQIVQHPNRQQCFEFEYPIDIELANGNIMKIINHDELMMLFNQGVEFELLPPFEVIDKDGDLIDIGDLDDLKRVAERCNLD